MRAAGFRIVLDGIDLSKYFYGTEMTVDQEMMEIGVDSGQHRQYQRGLVDVSLALKLKVDPDELSWDGDMLILQSKGAPKYKVIKNIQEIFEGKKLRAIKL